MSRASTSSETPASHVLALQAIELGDEVFDQERDVCATFPQAGERLPMT